ncbi:MAG: hypothetical protein B7Y45_12395 [Sphingomonas sp. 28-66-16]|nr:MAG: hypothetical protein B7Y45_12395 [Sphingomonas sp. 28-66-16]
MKRLLLPLLLLAAGGCATHNGRYPSLLTRPIEGRDESEPVRPTAVAVADPALDARLAELTKALAESATSFAPAGEQAAALTLAANGAAIGSDAWLDAQNRLARLDQLRGQSLSALADLDRLAIDRASAGMPPYRALEVLRRTAAEQADDQTRKIDALQAQLPQG